MYLKMQYNVMNLYECLQITRDLIRSCIKFNRLTTFDRCSMSKRNNRVTGKLARQLLQEVLTGKRALGERLNVKSLAEQYRVSRTPVNAALAELEQHRLVSRVPHKGFFVCDELPVQIVESRSSILLDEADLYHRLADDWLTDSIPASVTEQFMRERYAVTKLKVIEVMNRAIREGWAERNEGYGWKLLPVAKSTDAFSQLYRFRMAIEPAALLEPDFAISQQVINEQRQIQSSILQAPEGTYSDEELLQFGSLFHEAIISSSGNPYFLIALRQVNNMRKLMEYKAPINRERIVANCSEHLALLDLLEQGEITAAADALRQHLGVTLDRKVRYTLVWDQETQQKKPTC